MPHRLTSSVEEFNNKLLALSDASAKVGVAAAMAMANPVGADDATRAAIGNQIDELIASLGYLRLELEEIGQRKT